MRDPSTDEAPIENIGLQPSRKVAPQDESRRHPQKWTTLNTNDYSLLSLLCEIGSRVSLNANYHHSFIVVHAWWLQKPGGIWGYEASETLTRMNSDAWRLLPQAIVKNMWMQLLQMHMTYDRWVLHNVSGNITVGVSRRTMMRHQIYNFCHGVFHSMDCNFLQTSFAIYIRRCLSIMGQKGDGSDVGSNCRFHR